MKNKLYEADNGETTYVFVLRKKQIIALWVIALALLTGTVLYHSDPQGTISQGDELETNE